MYNIRNLTDFLDVHFDFRSVKLVSKSNQFDLKTV